MPFFPLFFFLPSPLSQTHRGKSPDQAQCHPRLGSQHPVLSRTGLFTRLPAAVPALLPEARLPPSFFWLCLTVKGLCARGTPRGYLTKSQLAKG